MLRAREVVRRLRLFISHIFLPFHLTWSSHSGNTWKRFKEYVIYSIIPRGLMVVIAVLEVVARGGQRSWASTGSCFFNLDQHLLSRIFRLSGSTFKGDNLGCWCKTANAFCEAISAMDATGWSLTSAVSTREMLLPAIQNLLKDGEALDPAHKEALEVILRERSGGALEIISKAMGIATSVGNFFSDSGLILGKKVDGIEAQVDSELTMAAAVSALTLSWQEFLGRPLRINFAVDQVRCEPNSGAKDLYFRGLNSVFIFLHSALPLSSPLYVSSERNAG